MSSKTALIPVQERGWRMGFANLLRKENQEWWGTRTWLIHLIIVLLVVGGTVLGVLFAPVPPAPTPEQANSPVDLTDPASAATSLFVIIGGIYMGVVAVIVMQETLIGEKQLGTAAWVLSKPVSRTAFILSKLLANSLALAVILVVIPGMVVFVAIGMVATPPVLANWLVGLALLILNLLFYVTLTLMLGTLSNTRGPVIGLPLLILFGGQFMVSLAPWLTNVLPWSITLPLNAGDQALAVLALQGQPIANTLPIISTGVLSVVFVVVAVWRFRQEEL